MRLLLYILLDVLMAPIFVIGMGFYLVPILLARGRVSGTTYEPFNGRLLYHLLGSRPDAAALKLAHGLPATRRLNLLFEAMALASRVSGYVPFVFRYPPPPRPVPFSAAMSLKCEFFDDAMREAVAAGDQVVILGAGWDTRAYGVVGRDAAVFEVDAPATQAVKRAAVEATGLDAAHVTFVGCDFNRRSWLEALETQGFDRDKRTFVLWEGVTMYLPERAIQSTLRSLAMLPVGSRIAFDFVSREWLNSVAGRMAALSIQVFYGEPWVFGFCVAPDPSKALSAYLEASGLSLERDDHVGDDGKGSPPALGLVVAVKR